MESNRKFWNRQQSELRHLLLSFEQHQKAIELFLKQHAMLHSASLSMNDGWSFEDEVLNDMSEDHIRRIPENCEHSVAWCMWHIARIEDVAMNRLIAGSPQVFHRENWLERMKITAVDTGNAMDEASVAKLSTTIDIDALRTYRLTVGRRTRNLAKGFEPNTLKKKVSPARLQQVMDEGAVVEAASGLIDYWGKRNIAGLLLMPATRHSFVHLNEALRLKHRGLAFGWQ